MKKNELTTPGSFTALSDFDLASAISEELAGLDEGFERIKIPAGGSTVFELPGAEGDDTEAVKEFSAVILYHHPVHTYYREKYTGGNNPPDCGSYDGKTGEGTPGGACASCPFSQFRSGESGGKACKNRRRVYVVREGEIFPAAAGAPDRLAQGVQPVHQAAAFAGKDIKRHRHPVCAQKGDERERADLLPGAAFAGARPEPGGIRPRFPPLRSGEGVQPPRELHRRGRGGDRRRAWRYPAHLTRTPGGGPSRPPP